MPTHQALTDNERRVLEAIRDITAIGNMPTGLEIAHHVMEHMRTAEALEALRTLQEKDAIEGRLAWGL